MFTFVVGMVGMWNKRLDSNAMAVLCIVFVLELLIESVLAYNIVSAIVLHK